MPDDVALLYEYVNSVDKRTFSYRGHRHVGGDELGTVQGLRSWLSQRGLIEDNGSISAADLATARALRSSLRKAIAAGGYEAASASTPSICVSTQLPLDVAADAQGRLDLRPRASGVRAALSLVLIQAITVSATGTWLRLKMCGAANCRWIFFDASRPRTARWCETDVCGNRMKKSYQRARRHSPRTE